MLGSTPPGVLEPRGLFKALPSQKFQHPLGAVGLGWLQEDTPLHSRSFGKGLMVWSILLAPSDPRHSNLGTQVCSGSRDVTPAQVTMSEGPRVSISISFLFFYHLNWGI